MEVRTSTLVIVTLGLTPVTDITPRNVLLQFQPISSRPTERVYETLSDPELDRLQPCNQGIGVGNTLGSTAQRYPVESASSENVGSRQFSEFIVLANAGCSPDPRSHWQGHHWVHRSPESILKSRASTYSDIWALSLHHLRNEGRISTLSQVAFLL